MDAANKIQKIILLENGSPGASTIRSEMLLQFEETGDWSQVAESVEAFMTQRLLENEKGVNGVVQAIANNGFGLRLTDAETEQLVTNLVAQGIDSWSKLFAFAITEVNGALGALLDNRAEAAESFTNLLTELGKENDYDGSQAANAAREWIAGIGASSESLDTAIGATQDLINTFINGNVQGKVFDGYISGATIFIDENGDGKQNFGEIGTTTDAQGNFLFEGDLPEGQLTSIGGIDIATQQPFSGTLTAPAGATTISPLTTLVNQLLNNGQASNVVAAEEILFQSLNIPRVDLSSFDPINVALDSESSAADQNTALQLQAITAQIQNLLDVSRALLSEDASTDSSTTQAITNSLLEALVTAQQNNQDIDLTNPQTITNIISTAATKSGITGDIENAIKQVATILSDINTQTQFVVENSDTDTEATLTDIFELQTLTQTKVVPAIEESDPETDSFDNLVTQFTGESLTNAANETTIGSLDGIILEGDSTDELLTDQGSTLPPPTTVQDILSPSLSDSTPRDDNVNVSIDTNVVFVLDEIVTAGTGNIVISDDAADTRNISVTDTSQVTFSGSVVIINPLENLNPNTHYNVQLDSGVIKDTAGNPYAGISDNATLDFTTNDPLAPVLVSSTPADKTIGVAESNNIVLTFDEDIVAGSGNIVISNNTGNDVLNRPGFTGDSIS